MVLVWEFNAAASSQRGASSALRLLLEELHREVGGEGGDGAEAIHKRLHLASQAAAASGQGGLRVGALCSGWLDGGRGQAASIPPPPGTHSATPLT